MGRITAYTDTDEKEIQIRIAEIVGLMPLPVQEDAQEAFYAEANGEYEKALEHAGRVLERVPDQDDIRMLRVRCLFDTGDMEEAEKLCEEMLKALPDDDDPHLFMGLISHARGGYQRAVREFEAIYPPKEYYPFYYTSFGDSLEKTGARDRARDMFCQEVRHYEETGRAGSVLMVDGAYQHILDLDTVLHTGLFQEDLASYKNFLKKAEMTPALQKQIGSTIVLLSRLLDKAWFRPDFLDLVAHIDRCEYLATREGTAVILSAYCALESYLIHEDRQVNALVEGYLAAVQGSLDVTGDAEKEARSRLVSYEWYLCRYYPDHKNEFIYVMNNYPHTWLTAGRFIDMLEYGDPDKIAGEKVDELIPLMAFPVSRDKALESLERAYARALKQEKTPAYLASGNDQYVRGGRKIMPNDPCPCGSGKKYKKCHGRNAR